MSDLVCEKCVGTYIFSNSLLRASVGVYGPQSGGVFSHCKTFINQ